MTDEERRLAELLQQAVPQPPRRITASEIAARAARSDAAPRLRLWLPAVTAAAVLLVAAASTVWLISGHSRPSAPTAQSSGATTGAATSAVSSASTSPSRTASSSARHSSSSASTSARHTASSSVHHNPNPDPEATISPIPAGVIGVFDARLLNVAPIGPVIVGGANTVYGLEGGQIDRFDLTTGVITAHAQLDPYVSWPPLVTGSALWQAVATPDAITIQRRDPQTLQLIGSNQITAPPESGWTPVLSANADDSAIFLGAADQLYSLDPASGAVQHQVSMPGSVGGLAVSPDGGRLYAGLNVQGSGIPRLLVLDIQHGLATLGNTPFGSGPIAGLLVTSGGVWGSFAGNTEDENIIRFARLGDLSRTKDVEWGGGGVPASVTLAGGAVWLSGVYQISCNDPRTGAVRAQGPQMGEMGLAHYFRSVQLVDGRYFASFQSNYSGSGESGPGLAVLTPPAACAG